MLDCSEDDLLAVVAGKGGLSVSVGPWGELAPTLKFHKDKESWKDAVGEHEMLAIRSVGFLMHTRKKYVCELGLEAELYKAWLL